MSALETGPRTDNEAREIIRKLDTAALRRVLFAIWIGVYRPFPGEIAGDGRVSPDNTNFDTNHILSAFASVNLVVPDCEEGAAP